MLIPTLYRRFAVALIAVAATGATATVATAAAQGATSNHSADSAYSASNWALAKRGYEMLLATEPDNATAWFRLGVAEHGLGHYQQAITSYAKARQLGFQVLSVQLRTARTYARLGDVPRALAYADSAGSMGLISPNLLTGESDFASLMSNAEFTAMVKRVTDAYYPCHGRGEAHQFDFWLGVWDLAPWNQPNAPRGAAGVNDVHYLLDQCVVSENWTGPGGRTGKSFNYYDTNLGKWRQVWMGDDGSPLDYTGEFRDGAMRFEGWTLGDKGEHVLQKLTFTPLGSDSLRQTFEESRDSAKTWKVTYDARYVRRQPQVPLHDAPNDSGLLALITPGSSALRGTRIKPYTNQWVMSYTTPDGKLVTTPSPSRPAKWTDEVTITAGVLHRRQTLYQLDGSSIETIDNWADAQSLTPIRTTSHYTNGNTTSRAFSGRVVRGFDRSADGDSTVVAPVTLAAPVFDFFGGMYDLLARALPLRVGYAVRLPSAFVGQDGAMTTQIVTLRTTGRESVEAHGHARMTWRVETDATPMGRFAFWLADDEPYLLRMWFVGPRGGKQIWSVDDETPSRPR